MTDLQAALCGEVTRNLKAGDKPRIPAGGELLWRWFGDLHATRRRGFDGPEPIAFGEIAAYAQLTGWPIEPRHVRIIRAMDEAFLRASAASTPPPGAKVGPVISDRSITGALFDAMTTG